MAPFLDRDEREEGEQGGRRGPGDQRECHDPTQPPRRGSFVGARTVPHLAVLAVVAAYPQLAERLIGGREVTWEAAAYGWPALTVLVWTVLLATFATLVSRVWQVARGGTSGPTAAASSAGSTSDPGAQLGDAITHDANTTRRLAARP
jgi:hypothetical protein